MQWIDEMMLFRLCAIISWTFAFNRISAVVAAFLPLANNPRAGDGSRGSQRQHPLSAPACEKCRANSSLSSRRGATPSPVREEVRYIAGRRALLLHPSVSSSSSSNDIDVDDEPPPLVVLGGMAQSIASWEFHLPYLARRRSVLIYEALGQGPPPPASEVARRSSVDSGEGAERATTTTTTSLENYYDDVSLERQGRDFWEVVDEAFFAPGSRYHRNNDASSDERMVVDVAGFSFGARVAMAAAATDPRRVRRLHLTGVGAERDGLANVILASWMETLGCRRPVPSAALDDDASTDDGECDPANPRASVDERRGASSPRLRSFAWSVILATYSEDFLASAGPDRVRTWADGVCRHNTEEGLRAILTQTHHGRGGDDDCGDHPWTPAAMARRIRSAEAVERCRIVVGSRDRMAHPTQALRLAEMLQTEMDDVAEKRGVAYRVIEGCGHAVPMEAMRLWREDLLGFLDE